MLHQILLKAGKYKYFFITCLLSLAVYSCKKEYAEFPYNDLEKFVITDNNGAELKAAIQDDKIIIYYPPLQTIPDSIKPLITVSDRATVSPASGTKIPFQEGTTFTVTAQDGSTKKYTLQAALNQPPLAFTTGSTLLGTWVTLSGEYFITDTSQTKVSLIGMDKKEHKIPGSLFTTFTAAQITANLPAKLGIDTGTYTVKLVSGKRTAEQGPIVIGPAAVKYSYPNISTIKRGEEYTVTDTSGYAMMIKRNGENINRGISLYVNNSQVVPVQVTLLTATQLTFKIPADCPLGYFYIAYYKNTTGTNSTFFSLTSAKRVTILP